MAKTPLIIGVSACIMHQDPKRAVFKDRVLYFAEQSFLQWAQLHGVLCWMIPGNVEGSLLESYVERIDGLLLQGGEDVSPLSYGEKPLKKQWQGDKVRDDYEISLYKAVRAVGKPILGICRGHQLINVAEGGTLYQDIEHQKQNSKAHRDWDIYEAHYHDTVIKPGSYLEKVFQHDHAQTNSIHHQAVKDCAPEFDVAAESKIDGVIEAITHKNIKNSIEDYVVGIQWHPEFEAQFLNDLQKSQAGFIVNTFDNELIIKDFLQAVANKKQSE